MMMITEYPVITLVVLALPVLLFLGYRRLLPKPIPGIPYNKEAAARLFGDIPTILSVISKGDLLFDWMVGNNVRHKYPVTQIFGQPFQKPWVIVTDFRESQDILLHRTKEFDRSKFVTDVFIPLVPEFHHNYQSKDERYRKQRNLLRDLMSPSFLNQVAAPQIYSSVQYLIELWTVKAKAAQEHPFAATFDIYNATLDAISRATFDLDIVDSATNSQLQLLSSGQVVSFPKKVGEPAEFPTAPRTPALEAILTLVESLETTVKSPIPLIHGWIVLKRPALRQAFALKEALFANEIDKRIRRISTGNEIQNCALDNILQRESAAATKENRTPDYKSRAILDELFGWIIGGHDTTTTTTTWWIKHISDNQQAQSILRSRLRGAYSSAAAEHRNPTVDEITKTQIPYLDAVIEEMSRIAIAFPAAIRRTLIDTTILGHHIPKGTDVMMMQNGPDFLDPPLPVSEEQRSESCRSHKSRVGSWDPADARSFKPERWIKIDSEGNETFDAMAGPHLAFGLGPRACFGKRYAYLQMRIIVIMLIWNFELKRLPEELNSYGAVEKLTKQPLQCYVKLGPAEW